MGNVSVNSTLSGTSVQDIERAASRISAADDMYNALWEAVELSDRTLPPSGRTDE